jgi:hypothetical protein
LVIIDTMHMETQETPVNASTSFNQIGGAWVSKPIRLERLGSISSVDQIQPAGTYQIRLGRELIFFGNMENEGCTLWNLNNANENYCDTSAWSGNRSIQHVRDENSPYNIVTNLETTIICRSTTLKYSLAGYIKTQNANNVTIEVQYFSDRTGLYMISSQTIGVLIDGDTPWTYYHKELSIPSGTMFFDIRLVSDIPASGTAYSWFDDVSLICWNNWGDFEIGHNIPNPNDYYFLQVKSSQNPGEVNVDYTETVFEPIFVDIDEPIIPTNVLNKSSNIFPNPFNPCKNLTTISFELEYASLVKITITDIHGGIINVLTNANYPSGIHNVAWDGSDTKSHLVKSGIYFYRIDTENKTMSGKCLVIKE